MNEPSLYRLANGSQRRDAKKIIEEFVDVLQLRSDGKDSLMDVGCGTGDVLMDFVVPILPETYSQVIGTDISPRMIQYSKKAYVGYDKVDFKLLDIGTDKLPLEYKEQFDHITSFYCLHWVQNQRQALKNIFSMLCNDGDCLLVFISSSPGYDAFHTLAGDSKWSEYMKDVDRFVPLSHNSPNAWLSYTNLLREVGFVDCCVEIRHKAFVYEGYENFRNHVMSVTPFVERIPLQKREEYSNEMCKYWETFCLRDKISHIDDYRYTAPYKIVVAYAKK